MLPRSISIIAVMNVVVVIVVVVVANTTNLGMTEVRGTVWSLSVAAPAVTTAWHTGLQYERAQVAKDVQRVRLVLFSQPCMHSRITGEISLPSLSINFLSTKKQQKKENKSLCV